ncbi:MAG TPA: type VII secretion integral membrane protein EccD [Lapillicoccus sp.]|nr:type VII secretion integral membrane protein EccD [Lapillicoccus sp.]
MSTNTQSADLVRVTVTAGDRTLDLVLPSRLPLAEIVPEVAGLIGSLDAYEAYGGYALVGSDGKALDLDASFLAQGVHDGQVLTLVTGAEADDKKVYDDVVEAVADSVEGLGAGWTAQNSRATALGLAALLLALGAAALFLQRQSGFVISVVAGVATLLLLLAGAVFARVRVDVAAAAVVLVGAAVYAVVGALSAVSGDVRELPLVAAGVVLAAVGGISMALLREHAWAFLPGVVVGLAAAATGGILLTTTFDANKVVAIVVVVAVILGSLIPWFALSSSRTMVTPMQSESEILAEPAPIDPDRIRRGVDLAHDLVLGLSLSVTLVVVLGAPSVVQLGWAGLGIVWAAGVVQMMRTRQFLLARDVVVGLLGGALGIVAGTVTALLQHPDWAVVIGPIVGVAAAAVLVSLALPDRATVRQGRILDLCEGLALFLLIPLLVVALGLIAAFRS